MMYAEIILAAIGLGAVFTIVFFRERSAVYIAGLLSAICAAFLIAFWLHNPFVLFIFSLGIGIALAWFARDEIVLGRKYFIFLIVFSALAAFAFWGAESARNALFSIMIATGASLWLSYRKTWIRRRDSWESKV